MVIFLFLVTLHLGFHYINCVDNLKNIISLLQYCTYLEGVSWIFRKALSFCNNWQITIKTFFNIQENSSLLLVLNLLYLFIHVSLTM